MFSLYLQCQKITPTFTHMKKSKILWNEVWENKTIGSGKTNTPYCPVTTQKMQFGLVYCLKCVIIVARLFHLINIANTHTHTLCSDWTGALFCPIYTYYARCVFVILLCLSSWLVLDICNYHIPGSLLFLTHTMRLVYMYFVRCSLLCKRRRKKSDTLRLLLYENLFSLVFLLLLLPTMHRFGCACVLVST